MNVPAPHNRLPERSTRPEQDTGLRFSLAYDLIGSRDRFINHPSGSSRIITYPKDDERTERFRDSLIRSELVLGNPTSDENDTEHIFVVPRSARPLSYDAVSQTEGNYSYNDGKLFYDLGYMLAQVLRVDEEPQVIRGDVGHAVAIVEFTQRNERALFLAPGVERLLITLEPDQTPVEYYADALGREFGIRFKAGEIALQAGFAKAEQDSEA